jgi:PAS domain S-box-containing protein
MDAPDAGRDFSALWDDAPCALVVADGAGNILHANQTFCTWLGYAPSDLVGLKRFQDLLPIGARVFLQTHWTPLLQIQGSVSEVQLDFNCRDGKRLPMVLNARRHVTDGVVRDEIAALVVNDRKLYERELLAARAKAESTAVDLRLTEDKMRALNAELSAEHRRKDIFLATLAHELRNPLAPLANVVEILRQESSAERRQWATDILERQVAQMAHLVDDLLDVSRITEGKVELRIARVDLGAALRLAVDEAMPAIQNARQQFTADIAAAPIWLDADQNRLIQIAVNLLNNASKYSPTEAQIGLRAWSEGGAAVVEVRDTGIGIPQEHLSAIFAMFSQLEPALERSTGGLGIGLALVKGLVDLHAGTIAAHSDGPGTGSCFTMRLPLASVAEAEVDVVEAPPTPSPAAPRHVKVAIVDDNVDAADTLGMALDLMGRETRVAHSAAAGLAMIAAFAPDVVVLDIGLPDMNGYDAARRLRAHAWAGKMVLIAVTGWGQESDKQLARDAGFDAHFTKPVDFHTLNDTLGRLVESRSRPAP